MMWRRRRGELFILTKLIKSPANRKIRPLHGTYPEREYNRHREKSWKEPWQAFSRREAENIPIRNLFKLTQRISCLFAAELLMALKRSLNAAWDKKSSGSVPTISKKILTTNIFCPMCSQKICSILG